MKLKQSPKDWLKNLGGSRQDKESRQFEEAKSRLLILEKSERDSQTPKEREDLKEVVLSGIKNGLSKRIPGLRAEGEEITEDLLVEKVMGDDHGIPEFIRTKAVYSRLQITEADIRNMVRGMI